MRHARVVVTHHGSPDDVPRLSSEQALRDYEPVELKRYSGPIRFG
ncbi:MAG TPA: hypothetical protein VLK65_26025 [Vicinamibacteria bacterium]|nr:hypothetical protein [Vicinamibacteria bacterium]